MATADILGRFIWHDLMTTDQNAASAFYPKVTGWKSQAWENDSYYRIWDTPKGPSGGTMVLSEEAQSSGTPAHWLAYIGTPDIESTVEDVERLGGRVVKPISEIPEVGKYAILADPQGAQFAVYTPDRDDGSETGGGFSWHELATTDIDAAFQFYSELFGWDDEGQHDMDGGGVYKLFGRNGKQIGGMYRLMADQPGGPNWMCYASVASVAEAVDAAKSAGGQVLNGPMEVPGGDLIAQLLDPQGAAFAVHETKQAAAKPKKVKKSAPSKQVAASSKGNGADESDAAAEKAAPRAKKRAAPAKKKAAAKPVAGKAAAQKASAKSKAAARSKGRPSATKKGVSSKAAARKGAQKSKKKAVSKGAAKKSTAARSKTSVKKKSTKVASKKKAAGRKRR